MLSEVIEENGTKKLRPLAGNFVNDAEKVPVGAIIAYWGTTPPENWLVCNGATFDTAAYPELYALLSSNHLPDLRESTLVGAGERTSGVTAHDVYSIGQFKDDQVGAHTHAYWDAYGNETNGLLGYHDNTQVNVHKALTSSPIQHSTWKWGVDDGWVIGNRTTSAGTFNSFQTWGGTTGNLGASWKHKHSVTCPVGGGDTSKWYTNAYWEGNHWAFENGKTSWAAAETNEVDLNHSHGIPSLYNDHRHIIPYVGSNTDSGNPANRTKFNGERNGNVTRTKQTGVAFIIKAK